MAEPARKDDYDPGRNQDPAAGNPDLEMAELLEGIDWGELQDFFYENLRSDLDLMRARLEDGDTEGLSRIGHGMKGAGGGVGLPRFTEMGKSLEDAGKAGNLAEVRRICAEILAAYLERHPEESASLRGYFGA